MSAVGDAVAKIQDKNSQFYSGLFGSSLSEFWYRLKTGTISPEETQRIANQAGADVARAGGSPAQVKSAVDEVKNFVNKFWPASGNTAFVLGAVGVALFAALVLTDSRRPVRRRGKSDGGGSGVLAGLLAAGVAWFLWSQYLKTSHKVGGDVALLPGEVSQSFGGPGSAETESGPIPLPNWIPLDVFNFGS